MNSEEYIASGILEEFVLGLLSEVEQAEVLSMAERFSEVKSEISLIEKTLEAHARTLAVTPAKELKSIILGKIAPPLLSSESKIQDYAKWLDTIECPTHFENMHMEVIHDTQEATMVIAWIKEGEQNHTHDTYSEKFLIVEGSCDAIINGEQWTYSVGDYVEFPIHVEHSYGVTSDFPMKVVACLAHSA